MTTRPAVPPLRRRPPPEAVVPTHEPAKNASAARNTKVMVYLTPELLALMDQLRLELRHEAGVNVDRSRLIRDAFREAMGDPVSFQARLVREEGQT